MNIFNRTLLHAIGLTNLIPLSKEREILFIAPFSLDSVNSQELIDNTDIEFDTNSLSIWTDKAGSLSQETSRDIINELTASLLVATPLNDAIRSLLNAVEMQTVDLTRDCYYVTDIADMASHLCDFDNLFSFEIKGTHEDGFEFDIKATIDGEEVIVADGAETGFEERTYEHLRLALCHFSDINSFLNEISTRETVHNKMEVFTKLKNVMDSISNELPLAVS